MNRAIFLGLFLAVSSEIFPCPAAAEEPITLEPAAVIAATDQRGKPNQNFYFGQPASAGRIDLTATNGFFDRCFEAHDPRPADAGDEPFIGRSFGYLQRSSQKEHGTARWQLWCPQAGEVKGTLFFNVPADETGREWTFQLGDEVRTLKVAECDGLSAQPLELAFTIKSPGQLTFTIDCTKNSPPAKTQIRFIRLEGSAIDKASLLRTRWRPAAVHASFSAPLDCPKPKMWVFETVPVSQVSSYSPLTTSFGYFGTSFQGDGRIKPGAGFNFSMWIAGAKATAAPPIEQMPRLIGSSIPDAQFETWGGEGTGTRPKAVAYPDGAARTIQALRIEAREGLVTYYGYFFDERAEQWRLYVSAQKPAANVRAAKAPSFGTLARTGSFCEVPGPPNRERSGDVMREIKRRGWFYGADDRWYRATLGKPSRAETQDDHSDAAEDAALTNRGNAYMDDFATSGWMSMSTGGIAYRAQSGQRNSPEISTATEIKLRIYLQPEKTKQLFELPVAFGKSHVEDITATEARVAIDIEQTGPSSKGKIYYGPVDCLTYSPRTVTRGSAVQIDMFKPERTWQSVTAEQKVTAGKNSFRLTGLKPQTTYYFRLFVEHAEGKSWDYQTHSFQTK